jgi:ABC-type amino acid transport substrate-binding protein
MVMSLLQRTKRSAIAVAVVLAGGVLLLSASPAQAGMDKVAADSYMAEIQKRGELRLAVKAELPGVGYHNPMTGKFEGFAIDLARSLARKLFGEAGHVEFNAAVPRTRITMVTEGVVDMTIGTMFITKKRIKVIDFAEPYWGSPTLILVKKDNNSIKTVADLAGKTVSSAKGSTTEREFREGKHGYPKVNLLLFDTNAASTEAVNTGRSDATVFDEVIGLSIMKVAPYYKFVGKPIKYSYYGIGIKKGHREFVRYVNNWLTGIKKSGEWKKLYAANLPGKVPEPPLPPYDKAFYQKY